MYLPYRSSFWRRLGRGCLDGSVTRSCIILGKAHISHRFRFLRVQPWAQLLGKLSPEVPGERLLCLLEAIQQILRNLAFA